MKPETEASMINCDYFHTFRIESHYAHAREKHPYFCDKLLPNRVRACIMEGDDVYQAIVANLKFARRVIEVSKKNNNTTWFEILNCEVLEALETIASGDTAAAVEELYDCVALLLRTIDVLEGRQPLGKPEEGGAK